MKGIIGKIFAVLFLLAFIIFAVWLVFFSGGVWVDEDGNATGQIFPKFLILVFFGGMPLFLLLWILFPKAFNKLMFKGINKFMHGGARMMEYRDQCEDRNIPDITVNGINLPTVVAAADMISDKINGEELPSVTDDLPYLCEECGFVMENTAKFCPECGTARKS